MPATSLIPCAPAPVRCSTCICGAAILRRRRGSTAARTGGGLVVVWPQLEEIRDEKMNSVDGGTLLVLAHVLGIPSCSLVCSRPAISGRPMEGHRRQDGQAACDRENLRRGREVLRKNRTELHAGRAKSRVFGVHR